MYPTIAANSFLVASLKSSLILFSITFYQYLYS
nr:MAG TPA: hypothetical protein [Caudoviricetes sp.]